MRWKQTPMDVRRFARTVYEALQAAKHAEPIALDREEEALASAKDLMDALRAAVEQKKEGDARWANDADRVQRVDCCNYRLR